MSFKLRTLRVVPIVLLLLVLAGGGWALGQIFGIGTFTGGTLSIKYQLTKSENDPSPGTLTMNIAPAQGGKFQVTETFEMVTTADQMQVLVFSHGFAHIPKGYLDMTPIQALDMRPVEAGKEILLPDGAKLVTQEEVTIAGITAVKGIYTHPKYEDQRAIIAISDLETRKIMPYPPFLRIERNEGSAWNLIALTELLSIERTD